VLSLPRKARPKSESGIYHIIMRGINRQTIFCEDEDYHRFLQTLKHYKEICGYQIYAYCLMSNHIHLLLKIEDEPLAQVMRRVCGKFVYWYNKKYERVGYLFQDRFRSESVEDDSYLLTVIRYIHQNPLKAGLVDKIDHYPWSSYNAYSGQDSLIDQDFVLNIFNDSREKALKEFIKFNNQNTDQKCMDIEEIKRITDQEAINIIKRVCKINSTDEIHKLDKKNRDSYLRELKREGLSVRQIEGLTGITRGVVQKA
jgi:putative transposase